MAGESGAPDNSFSAPPPSQQEVEELEQVKVAEPEKTSSAPDKEMEEVKMPIAEESSTLQDRPEDKKIDPQAKVKFNVPPPEVLPPKEEESLQVNAEPDPDEPVAEKEPEPEVVNGKEYSKEVSIIDDEKQKEESVKESESSEAAEELEKTSEANPAEEKSEQKPENPAQEEEKPLIEAEESKAPMAVDEPKPLIEGYKAEEAKETVEEAPVHAVEDEVVEKIEARQSEYTGDQGNQEPITQDKAEPKGEYEVAEMVEKTSEEIKPRENLEALMRREVKNKGQVVEEKATEIYEKVAFIEKETQADEKDVEQSSAPEAVEKPAAEEDKGKELSEAKKDEEPTKELVPDIKDAKDKLEENEQKPGEKELEKDVVTNGSTEDVTEKSLEVESVSRDVELTPESKEEGTKRETEIAAPIEIKNRKEEGRPGNVTITEETKEPETKEEKIPDETVQERGAEEVLKPEEQSIKDTDNMKDSQEHPKEEAPTKPVKQSKNLISKVRHTLVKAKKAIIGKSPASKSVPSEIKG